MTAWDELWELLLFLVIVGLFIVNVTAAVFWVGRAMQIWGCAA